MTRLVCGVIAMVLTLGAAGCGSTTTTALPALESRLERVDAAAIADDPQQLESAVAALLRAAEQAVAAGDLTGADLEQIRSAAEALLAASGPAVPAPTDRPTDEATSPPPTDDTDEDDADDEEVEDAEDSEPPDSSDRGPDKSKGKSKGKAKGRDD